MLVLKPSAVPAGQNRRNTVFHHPAVTTRQGEALPHRDDMHPATQRRRHCLRGLAGLALAAAWPAATLGQPAPLTLGVLPNVSARQLAAQYQGLRQFLETHLGRPVLIATAPDFAAFHARAIEGQYGLYVTAANLGALADSDGQGQAIGLFEPGMAALAVALRQRAAGDPVAALRGQRLALSNPVSLVAMRGQVWLQERGLLEGRDYSVVHAPNEDSLARWLSSGDAPLALMSRGEFNQLSEARRQLLEVVEAFATVSGFLVMVPMQTPAAEVARLQRALKAFFASPELAAFTTATGARSFREAVAADLAGLQPFVEVTRRRMAAGR